MTCKSVMRVSDDEATYYLCNDEVREVALQNAEARFQASTVPSHLCHFFLG